MTLRAFQLHCKLYDVLQRSQISVQMESSSFFIIAQNKATLAIQVAVRHTDNVNQDKVNKPNQTDANASLAKS